MANPKCVAVIQARMGSKRFPGKVLMPIIEDVSVLTFLIDRLLLCRSLDEIIVATTTSAEDDVITEERLGRPIKVLRGSEENVLERYLQAAEASTADVVVRVTADCPLVDPSVVDSLVRILIADSLDYATNTLPPTYPDGLDVEVFTKDALSLAHELSHDLDQREHVTSILRTDSRFSSKNLIFDVNLEFLRVTIDYKIDLEVVRNVVQKFYPRIDFGIEDIYNLWKSDPDIFQANKRLIRNSGAIMSVNQKYWSRAKNAIAGGNHLLSKRPDMFLPGAWPTYFEKCSGIKVTDYNQNDFLDFSLMGVGCCSLGYDNLAVQTAVHRAVDSGVMSTLNCFEEVRLAERLIDLHPWADKARFARTGGEINSVAVRMARRATSRSKVVVCGYHGWHDWYLAVNLGQPNGLKEHLLDGLDPGGVPHHLEGSCIAIRHGDSDQLKQVVGNGDIAAVVIEPCRNDPVDREFLVVARELCNKKGTILIFDECTSGFRKNFGGIHLETGVNPDVATFGKALGNGFAITALLGTEAVCNDSESSFMSSTFWTERIGPCAALATLDEMERIRSWESISNYGKHVRKVWKDAADLNKVPLRYSGIDAIPSFQFESEHHQIFKTYLTQQFLKSGILASNLHYASSAHCFESLAIYREIFDSIFFAVAESINANINPSALLDGLPSSSGFGRLN